MLTNSHSIAVLGGVGLAFLLAIAPSSSAQDRGASAEEIAAKELSRACDLLDDPKKRNLMDALELRLLIQCGRADELGKVRSEAGSGENRTPGTDALVNDPTGESGATQTQSETSLAISDVTGTVCSGFNDAYSGVVQGLGFTGTAHSNDGGVTFTDNGALSSASFGDPSMIWRKADGLFYIVALHSSGGLGIWRSPDDCQSFQFVGLTHVGNSDDKELAAVDNNPASPFYGRIYVAWTDFAAGGRIFANYSDNGSNWSTAVGLSAPGADVQGAWPTVAPNGDLYIGWVRWNPYDSGPIDIEIARSVNGGQSYSLVTNPITGKINPYLSAARSACGRPALKGNIRYLPSPQLAVTANGDLHVIYSYDPDGRDVGDIVNIYYRRSTDQGQTWQPEIQLNDDGTLLDQWQPALSVGPSGRIVASWYDRRLDANNLLFDYYARVSDDGGTTWLPSERISDASSGVYLDPNLATCYHGDYDQQVQTAAAALIQWSDDRAIRSGHADPDVYFDSNVFQPDFILTPVQSTADVCAPDSAIYDITVGQTRDFSDPVTMTVSGNPVGTSAAYNVNPVVPPGATTLTIGNTGAAAAGSYQVNVTGTAGPLVRSVQLGLQLTTAAPGSFALVSPADGAVSVPRRPTLTWTASAQAASYLVEVATDAAFANIGFSGTTTGTSLQLPGGLATTTLYFWRVTPENTCGGGSAAGPFSFTTELTPPILLVDDDDNQPDVRAFYENALNALGKSYDVWDTANSDNEPGAGDLSVYSKVIWFTGVEFGGFAGPGAAGETALASWLDGGGACLLLSSQDYYYDRGLTAFMTGYLGISSAQSDVGQRGVLGVLGYQALGPYALAYPFTNYSDRLVLQSGVGRPGFIGNVNVASSSKRTAQSFTSFFAFPWEAIATDADRQAVMMRFLTLCR